jgi:TPR repeat protein
LLKTKKNNQTAMIHFNKKVLQPIIISALFFGHLTIGDSAVLSKISPPRYSEKQIQRGINLVANLTAIKNGRVLMSFTLGPEGMKGPLIEPIEDDLESASGRKLRTEQLMKQIPQEVVGTVANLKTNVTQKISNDPNIVNEFPKTALLGEGLKIADLMNLPLPGLTNDLNEQELSVWVMSISSSNPNLTQSIEPLYAWLDKVNALFIPEEEKLATKLFDAINNNDKAGVEVLIKTGANVNFKHRQFGTPLNMAIRKENIDIVKELLAAGADPSIAVDRIRSPLQHAFYQGNVSIFKILLESTNFTNQNRAQLDSLINKAVEKKDNELLALLSNVNAGSDYLFFYANESDENVLDNVKTRLDVDADTPLAQKTNDSHGNKASESNDAVSIQRLLSDGKNVNQRDEKGQTVLHNLVGTGDEKTPIDLVELLLKKGANPNLKAQDGSTSLLYAARNPGGNRFIPVLLEYGANPALRDNKDRTIFELMWSKGADDVIVPLLQAGTSLNDINSAGFPVILDVGALLSPKAFETAVSLHELDANAAYWLGRMFENGNRLEQDYIKAAEWYRKSAAKGDMRAQTSLGLLYANGTGVPEDDKQAVSLFSQAASRGYPLAENNLGYMYESGQGVEQNLETAADWYQKAAEKGLALAQTNLAFLHINHTGMIDEQKAVKLFKRAAEQKLGRAQFALAQCYRKGIGVEQNKNLAVQWLKKAVDNSYKLAFVSLAEMYAGGEGIEKDVKKAITLYKRAAEQGVHQVTAKIKELEMGIQLVKVGADGV